MQPKIRFVVATRRLADDFHSHAATGRSLKLYEFLPFLEVSLAAENRLGLPMVYNKAIEAARDDPAILVFIHDDVHLCSFYWPNEIYAALANFHLVGVAGSRIRDPMQPTWVPPPRHDSMPHEYLSGIIAHGHGFPPSSIQGFGPPCHEVRLLDGVVLIAYSEILIRSDIRFDERFEFHHYDMDLCRQLEKKGLKMGTWPISLVHESHGNFDSPEWRASCERYFAKWGS